MPQPKSAPVPDHRRISADLLAALADLQERNYALRKQLARTERKVEQLSAHVAELRASLNLNASLPPRAPSCGNISK